VTLLVLISSILLGVGALAWGFAQVGFTSLAGFMLIFGLVWLYSLRRGWAWFSSLGLFVAVFFAAIGFWFEFDLQWMIAGVVLALFAWDLTEFRHRLRFMAMDDHLRGMERRHLARVSLFTLAGLALVSVALFLQLRFTFEWGVLLVLVILLGIAQIVAWMRR
jgi:hypothetical protein